MTDREKAIVMAYTGIAMLTGEKFSIFHEYVEKIMNRSVWTHEMGIDLVAEEIKERAKPDFLELCATTTGEDGPEHKEEVPTHKFEIRRTSGKNPLVRGKLTREVFKTRTNWGLMDVPIFTTEVKTIEDLLEIIEETDTPIVLEKTYHKENPCKYAVEIYDYYRE